MGISCVDNLSVFSRALVYWWLQEVANGRWTKPLNHNFVNTQCASSVIQDAVCFNFNYFKNSVSLLQPTRCYSDQVWWACQDSFVGSTENMNQWTQKTTCLFERAFDRNENRVRQCCSYNRNKHDTGRPIFFATTRKDEYFPGVTFDPFSCIQQHEIADPESS